MLTTRVALFRCSLFLLILVGYSRTVPAEFEIKDGDTVAFLGDSITAARTYSKLIESYSLLRFPDRSVRFVNIGVGGDTAAGGLDRLERDVFSRDTTLLVVAYGINDIGWGVHADAEHRQTYLDSIRGIVDACVDRGVRVFICSAAVTAADPFESEDSFLQKMCDDGMLLAREHGGESIDVQRSMREIQQRVWEANQNSAEDKQVTLHASDGIHLSELGQLAMAYSILKGLGAPAEVSSATMDAATGTLLDSEHCSITDVRQIDGRLEFTRLDQGLPFNNGLFYTFNYRFVPVPEQLNRYRLTVTNLPAGQYQLSVDGRDVGTFPAGRLGQGINIASATGNAWQPGGPWDVQANVLKSLTEARHNADIALRLSGAWLNDTNVIEPLSERSVRVNEELEQMQRLLAQPRPYRFVLTPVKPDDAGADADGEA